MPKIVFGRALRFSVTKSTMKLHLKFGTFLHCYSLLVLNPTVRTLGILSRCKNDDDGSHCLFMDFDDCMLSQVVQDVLRAQRQYEAGTAIILRSGESDFNVAGDEYGSFHVIFPAKFLFGEVVEIISKTSCDYAFRDTSRSFNYRAFCLRIYPKYSEHGAIIRDRPTLRDVIWSETGREIHQAMYDFLRLYYGMPEWEGLLAPKLDGLMELNVLHYNTTAGWNSAFRERIKRCWLSIKMRLRLSGGGMNSAACER
jgi:hypothetical protein